MVKKFGSADQSSALRRQVYLLTCWQERDGDPGTVTWRFRLEAPGIGRPFLFTSLAEVIAKIEEELELGDRTS